MMKDVHTEHCCTDHGCKYGADDCTVTTGKQKQSYPCEECGMEEHNKSDSGWVSVDKAPKGGGADSVDSPEWVEPPKILLLLGGGEISVGYWDWYYAEGGNGYEGGEAWIEPVSGERLDMHYDAPIGWMLLPNV